MVRIIKGLKSRLGMLYLKRYRTQLSEKPLDGENHYKFSYASAKFGLYNLAYSELKCAEYLGVDSNKITLLKNIIIKNLPDLVDLDVNQYQRFTIMQAHLNRLLKAGDSILDIGGGHGILSQFVPENLYFLVEPSVNGISGIKLPYSDNSFDAVVTCHVLEHIEHDDRPGFINELLRVARKNVLIFNPFRNEELNETERLQLVVDVTNAVWAKEHMECGLPDISEVTDYISAQGLPYKIKEYGDIYTSMATVFMSYFAGVIHADNLVKINRHLNQKYDQLRSGGYPTNIMIEISKL